MRETVPSSRLATHTEPPPAVTASGLWPTEYSAVMRAAVGIDQPDMVLVDASEAVGLEYADDPEGQDTGDHERRRAHQQRPRPAPGRSAWLRLGRGGQVERRVVGEDLLVQALQLRAGLDADLLHETGPCGAVGLECLRLPPGPVEREHPLAVQALAQRVLGDERVELAGQLGVTAGRQVGIDRRLRCPQPQVLEPADLRRGERLVGQVGEWLAAPQRQCLTRPRLLHEAFRSHRVDLSVHELERVAAAVGHDANAVAVERASEMRDVELHHLGRARRQLVAPQPLREPVGRHRPARLQRKHREHRPLLAGAQLDGPVPEANLERP